MSECKFAVEAFHAYIESIGLSRPAGTLGELKAFKAGAEWQRSQQSAPAGYVLVPVELIDSFPEINPNNYSHDQVCDLDAWGCDLVRAALAAASKAEPQPVSDDVKDELSKAIKMEAELASLNITNQQLREQVAELEADLKLTGEMLVEVSRKGMALREELSALKSAPAQPQSDDARDALVDALKKQSAFWDTRLDELGCLSAEGLAIKQVVEEALAAYSAAQEKK